MDLLGEAPYVVLFTVSVETDKSRGLFPSAVTFQVEFASPRDMPHTIWTFFKMVKDGLYKDTVLTVEKDDNGNIIMAGGDPRNSRNKKTQSNLLRRYAEMGYGVEPLFFEEVSLSVPCHEYSMGFVNRGPNLFIPLVQSGKDRDGSVSRSCPGKIINGRETLSEIKSLVGQNHRITIVDARILDSTGTTVENK
jgi:hypothetical protein